MSFDHIEARGDTKDEAWDNAKSRILWSQRLFGSPHFEQDERTGEWICRLHTVPKDTERATMVTVDLTEGE